MFTSGLRRGCLIHRKAHNVFCFTTFILGKTRAMKKISDIMHFNQSWKGFRMNVVSIQVLRFNSFVKNEF